MSNPKRARCYEKGWTYYSAADTDVARTFKRIKRQQKQAEEAKAEPPHVVPLIKARRKMP